MGLFVDHCINCRAGKADTQRSNSMRSEKQLSVTRKERIAETLDLSAVFCTGLRRYAEVDSYTTENNHNINLPMD